MKEEQLVSSVLPDPGSTYAYVRNSVLLYDPEGRNPLQEQPTIDGQSDTSNFQVLTKGVLVLLKRQNPVYGRDQTDHQVA